MIFLGVFIYIDMIIKYKKNCNLKIEKIDFFVYFMIQVGQKVRKVY